MIGPNRSVPADETSFLRRLWEDCWPNLAGLLGANLLFLGLCAPALVALAFQWHGVATVAAITVIGPGLLGLFTYAANLVLERQAGVWRDGAAAFRKRFGSGVLIAAVAVGALTAHRLAMEQAVAAGMTAGPLAAWAMQAAVLVLLLLTGVHVLSLIGMYRQGVREAFRNACLLTIAHPLPTVGVVMAGILIGVISRGLQGGPLVILPALLTVLAVRTTRTLVERHTQAGEHRSRPS